MLDAPFLELQFVVADGVASAAALGFASSPGTTVLANAVGVLEDRSEVVDVRSDMIIFRTEAELFCGSERTHTKRLMALGDRVYERFCHWADAVPSFYGAILIEYTIEMPDLLLSDNAKSIGFRNFFISDSLGSNAIDAIRNIVGNSIYMERLKSGTYFSSSAEFNPDRKGIPSVQAMENSVEIARVVGAFAMPLMERSRKKF